MHVERSSYSFLKLAITFWQRIDRIFGDEFWTDLNLIGMPVRKSQLTNGWTRMIKFAGLLVCNTTRLTECNKDTPKTSYSTSDMSREVFIKSSRLVCMIPGIEIYWKTFAWKQMTRIFVRERRIEFKQITLALDIADIPIGTIRKTFGDFERNSISLWIYKFKFNLYRTITKRD